MTRDMTLPQESQQMDHLIKYILKENIVHPLYFYCVFILSL